MAPSSAYWRGYLKLSLVTCPVALTPAITDMQRVRFKTINAKTGNRVRASLRDAETGKAVEDDELVKGYATGDGGYVVLEEDELESVRLESVHTIDIQTFVNRDEIDRLWLDKPYYLAPDDEVGNEAFSVIREGMAVAGVVAVAPVVFH